MNISGGAPNRAFGHGSPWTSTRRKRLDLSSPGASFTSRLPNLSRSGPGAASMSPSATRSWSAAWQTIPLADMVPHFRMLSGDSRSIRAWIASSTDGPEVVLPMSPSAPPQSARAVEDHVGRPGAGASRTVRRGRF